MYSSPQELPGLSEIQAISLFLQFVPLEGEIHDFFKPISSLILHLLRGRRCLPSDPYDPEQEDDLLSLLSTPSDDQEAIGDGTCVWKQPSQLIAVQDDFVRKHIRQDLLESTLHLSYLNSLLLPALNVSLQSQLGVRRLNIQDLIAIAEAVLDRYQTQQASGRLDETTTSSFKGDCMAIDSDSEYSDLESCPDSQALPRQTLVNWIAHWFACVQIVMKDTRADLNPDSLKSLRRLQIIPLSDGSLVSADSTSLFFPAESEGESKYIRGRLKI